MSQARLPHAVKSRCSAAFVQSEGRDEGVSAQRQGCDVHDSWKHILPAPRPRARPGTAPDRADGPRTPRPVPPGTIGRLPPGCPGNACSLCYGSPAALAADTPACSKPARDSSSGTRRRAPGMPDTRADTGQPLVERFCSPCPNVTKEWTARGGGEMLLDERFAPAAVSFRHRRSQARPLNSPRRAYAGAPFLHQLRYA